ncbi:MAG: Uncharacterized protein FD135_914 [Comamonadaceae bacterium]|nr:MAG: Uncharacterized protein FD135_914 [Comamonadaceae bacterium]
MSLAWFKPVHISIYLGIGFSLLKINDQKVRVIQHLSALTSAQMLDQLSQEMVQLKMPKTFRKHTIKFTLSAALCPASSFSVPKEVTQWDERQRVARASAAMVLGVDVEQLVCEIDTDQSGVAATISQDLLSEILHWAEQQNYHVASIHPLWKHASQCPLARKTTAQGLLVQEPDAYTLLAQDESGIQTASTLIGNYDQADGNVNVRRWLIGLGISDEKLLKLRFSSNEHSMMRHGPRAWAAHWTTQGENS